MEEIRTEELGAPLTGASFMMMNLRQDCAVMCQWVDTLGPKMKEKIKKIGTCVVCPVNVLLLQIEWLALNNKGSVKV